jgi:hypothetical protein
MEPAVNNVVLDSISDVDVIDISDIHTDRIETAVEKQQEDVFSDVSRCNIF